METFIPRGRITGPILPSFVLRENISPGAKMLYALLCNHASDKDHCWPSHRFLAQELGYCVSSIKNWLGELVRARLLAIRRAAYRSSTYVLLRPRTGAASTASAVPVRRETNFDYPQANFGHRNNSRKNLEKLPPYPPTAERHDGGQGYRPSRKRGGISFRLIPFLSAFGLSIRARRQKNWPAPRGIGSGGMEKFRPWMFCWGPWIASGLP